MVVSPTITDIKKAFSTFEVTANVEQSPNVSMNTGFSGIMPLHIIFRFFNKFNSYFYLV